MELLEQNYVNTTTQLAVNSNTSTAGNVFIPDIRFQYASDTLNNDATTATMRINFSETLTVNRIALVGHNLRGFTLFYNGATASTFALTATANTTASNYSSNSDTSHYFSFADVACTSVSIDMKTTIVANQNKYLGYLVISQKLSDFDNRVPSASNYRPTIEPQAVVHRLSDGGTRIQTLEDKRAAKISFDYLTTAARDDLKDIFDAHEEMIFCPFGTTTGWDAFIFPCVWEGGFDFFQYSDNAADAGFSGSITLKETPQ